MSININSEVALTYLIAKKKQTLVASLGVTFGISMYIFMNSLISGTNEYFEKMTLSATPHIRLYRDHQISNSDRLNHFLGKASTNLISNPKMVNSDERIDDPYTLLQALKTNPASLAVSPQITATIICSNGSLQENGNVSGVNILEQDKMFDITSTMIAGTVKDLSTDPNGIIIGSGMAENLSLKTGDNITLTTSKGSTKVLHVSGIFRTTIKNVDQTKCYANLSVVQQLLKKDRSYITDIYVNLKDYTKANRIGKQFELVTGYRVETWQSANEQSIAARMIRDMIANSVVITILIVAGFGIYNILNMMIYEKIKEIAILKATGFAGRHVVAIFIFQALFIGLLGSFTGILLGWLLSKTGSMIYIGKGNLEYLPVSFYAKHYIQGALFGIITSFFAGYVPALRASHVDPVEIIRG
ncbi:ABC transporter permease [Chryseolinea lacunae]|uniref:ABC transporter permease n=1 Tax=Chryseolinea lacunae TaxID=2801331 RepID=A0ABS1L2H4_9BACT|nr:FtsX-like permease family protein [Chryseolinea lacunae]MBL0745885.1 ABC transporter permease [Chryseolinea lacunae]